MIKKEKGKLSNSFNIEFLPREPLIGLNLRNCKLIDDEGKERPLYGIELGLLFIKIGYVNVDYSD